MHLGRERTLHVGASSTGAEERMAIISFMRPGIFPFVF